MGIIVGIISFFLGLFIFVQGLASMFIGLPLAIKTECRNCKKTYIGNVVYTMIINVVVIVLMATVLKEFLAWILISYFLIPLIVFFFTSSGYLTEAKRNIIEEIESDKAKAEMLYDLFKHLDKDE